MVNALLTLLEPEKFPSAAAVHAQIKEMNDADIAEVFKHLDTQKAVKLFRMLPKRIAADVFINIDSAKRKEIIELVTDKEQAFLIDDLFADDAADLIEEMPANVVQRLLKNASPEQRQNINYLLKYPDDTAGSIMTVEYVRLKPEHNVARAFEIIREFGADKKSIYTCYIIDDKRSLLGYVSVKDLLLAKPDTTVESLMHKTLIHATTHEDLTEVANKFKKYDYITMPVIDSEEKLVGIITVDDILHVIEEEHTEHVAHMGKFRPSDKPYLQTTVVRHSMNRIVWLTVLMLSAILTGLVISRFEDKLAALPALFAFVPMLCDTGGNAGAQSSTQIIRSMALGEITTKQWLAILWKELRIALICGVILAIITFARILAFGMGGSHTGDKIMRIATAVSLSLVITVIIAKTLGCLLPVLAKLCRVDPALMSAPLITTIVDTMSLLVYFGFATLFLGVYM